MFEVSSLASSSSGNCFYISHGDAGILVDAGISARQIAERLKGLGKDISAIQGIFLTHEHMDHTRGIEVLTRKFDIPVFLTRGTLANSFMDMGQFHEVQPDESFSFHGLKMHPFSVHHDAAEPV